MQTSHPPFKYQLGQRLALTVSGENGECISRSEHSTAEPQYLIRYRMADGRATEQWWSQSAIEPCDGILASAIASPTGTLTPVASPTTLPRIGAWWEAAGGNYAGIARGVDGAPDYHLVLCPDKPDTLDLAWQPALDWAAALRYAGHADWALPTRPEAALLFANLRDQFDPRWHWTSEQSSRNLAWIQIFVDGGQYTYGKSYEGRARAVRRLVIFSFNPS